MTALRKRLPHFSRTESTMRLNFAQLWQRHGGVAVPRPKLIPLAE
jgi:hypothetical protein